MLGGDEMQAKTLFSRHYLQTRLPDHPEWAEDPQPAFEAIHTRWQRALQFGDSWNEAQTEDDFVKPVLRILGWSYIVQTKSQKGGQITRPDYAFFADDAARDAAYAYQEDDDAFYSRALAIAEAKYWGRPLSQKDNSGRNTWKAESNPSHQMVSYLAGARVPWGILTNGRTWRLYSREVSSTASEFYEVDLVDIFTSPLPPGPLPLSAAERGRGSGGWGEVEAFKRFWLFFRRDAFLPDAGGRVFVQRVHEGSATYARQISDKLKELVFEEIMPEIAGGFVAYRHAQLGIQQETEESLRQIYQASLSLLYKLLFLLYAEARGLLPIANPGYREQSLTAPARWAAERLDKSLPLSEAPHATPRYDALLALFHRIDQGDPSLGIPRYNGGLFNPANPDNQFLEKHKLSDRAVARAVDILVRDAGQPVDYAYISVRNLGAIYEGLLENKLRVTGPHPSPPPLAGEPAPASRPAGASQDGPPRGPGGAGGGVELVNDKGERKASGSYYTPDYVVEYIVQHTLDPILAERDALFQAAMDRCADLRRRLQRTSDTTTVGLLRGQLDEAERDAREAFLGIKVLDPAMGSGHFLVNAVDHLTDGIIQHMQTYHDRHPDVLWAWNPIQVLIEKVRHEILAEMERQGIPLDPARLDDTALLTRLVMKRCIYGVDLNPMAVELAKLSLWLHSFTVGAPLSFLDHHLRWGNSLIGTDVRSVEQGIRMTGSGQLGLFAGPFAGLLDLTSLMTEVAEQADATLADVRHSAEVFDHFRQDLTPYKQVLDLWVSQYFGNPAAREFLTLYGADVLPTLKGQKQVSENYQAAIQQARTLWQEKRFFHWDLEFPEVFVDLRRRDWAENPGFDAVIGNPPYVFITSIAQDDRDFYFSEYDTCDYRFDLYGLFVDLGIDACSTSGLMGYIVPHSLLNNNSFEKLRLKIIREARSVEVLDFTDRVFADAANEPMILIVAKKHHVDEGTHLEGTLIPTADLANAQRHLKTFSASVVQNLPGSPFLVRGGTWLQSLLQNRNCRSMGDYVSATQGLRTGDNARFLTTAKGSAHLKVLAGADIHRYGYDWPGTYVLYDRKQLDAPRDEIFWIARERIIAQEIRNVHLERRIVACFDDEGYIGLNTTNVIISKPDSSVSLKYIMAIFSSSLINEYFRACFVDNHIATQYILSVPIYAISFTTPAEERARLAAEASRLAEVFVAGGQPLSRAAYAAGQLAPFVAARLSASQSDVVHDLLAALAEQMIAMHQEKQTHLRAFRLDLAGYLDEKQLSKLNRLYTPKRRRGAVTASVAGGETPPQHAAYQQATDLARSQLGDLADETLNLDDFWRLNRAQWMWLLRQNLGQVANMSGLVAVYEQYNARLAPLMRRIQRTDWLIDQVVYRLYGLTEEEIRVVEGP